MSSAVWNFSLVDINGNNITNGELPLAFGRSITYQLNAPTILQFQLPLTSDDASAVTIGSSFIKAYRTPVGGTKTLVFYGPAWVDEIQTGSGSGVDSILVTAMDPLIYLSRRYTTAAYTATDQGTILKNIIDTTNTSDGETGIRTSSGNITASTSVDFDKTTEKPTVLDVVQQFSDQLDGCETWVSPIEYAGGKISDLYIAPKRGSIKDGVVFGYGDATVANCTSMGRTRNADKMVNDHTGFTDLYSSTKTNTTSINSYRRLVLDQSYTNEKSKTLLANRVQGYLSKHDTPDDVAEYTITTGPRAPKLFDSFTIGDTVWLDFNKGISFQVQQRVYACTVDIDDQGLETYSSIELRPS